MRPDVRSSIDPPPPSRDAAGLRTPPACRWCAKALSPLERHRGTVCDSMNCRRLAADAATRAQRADELDAVRTLAAIGLDEPALATAPVVWLTHHGDELVPPTAEDRADLRDALLALEVDAGAWPAKTAAEPDPDLAHGTTAAALGGQLCALCRGRCCRMGLRGNAFLEAGALSDWLVQQDAGATWADAVDHYIGFVAAEHLDQSCLFHGARGCTLPRERRSDVCNRFACDALEQLRDRVGTEADAVAVAGVVQGHLLHATHALTAQGSRALPGLDGQLP